MILQGRDSDADNALEEVEGFSLLILLGFSFFFFCEFILKLSCSIRYYGALAYPMASLKAPKALFTFAFVLQKPNHLVKYFEIKLNESSK